MVSDRHGHGAASVTHLQPRVAWLRRACLVAALISGGVALILAALAVAWHETDLFGLSLIAATLTLWLVVVGRGALGGQKIRGVFVVSAGIFVIEVTALLVVPESVPILALATLVPLMVAAPHLDPWPLSRPYVGVGAMIITLLVAAVVMTARADAAVGVRFALEALATAGVTLFVLFMLERSDRTVSGLRDAALRDGLTGLHNRTLFIDRLEHAMARSQRTSATAARRSPTTAVVYLDIDDFKDINDRHGHGHGDAVLRAVADRLRQTARASDTIARIGGDEFAVLVEDLAERADVVALAERLMESMADPIALPEGTVVVRLSAGLAFSDDGGGTAEALLQNADHAMYQAKRRSPGEFLIYDPALRARSEERRRVKRALRGVVERDELRLHYQPLVRLNSGYEDLRRPAPATGTIAAFEALVRWQDPARGLLMPADFVGLAEETGDIMAIGRWVLETACRQLRAWQRIPGRSAISVMVNLSALELEQRRFSKDIEEVVDASGITPHSLVFEITESAVVPDRPQVRAVLDQLQGCGVHLVIDDFGTGYSSLSYLSSLPIDGLKIARPFVRDAVGDRRVTALLRAIIEVGVALGAVVVAEGIETRQEQLLMRSLGCHLGQGFLFSRPLPAADVEALLRAPRPPWEDRLGRPLAISVSPERGLEVPRADLPRRVATVHVS